jgi:hypothetical protein
MPNEVKSKVLLTLFCVLFDANLLTDPTIKYQKLKIILTQMKNLCEENFALKFNRENFSMPLKCLCFMHVMLNFILDDEVALCLKTSGDTRLQSSMEKLVTDIIKTELVDFNEESKSLSVVELVQWSTQMQNILNSYL